MISHNIISGYLGKWSLCIITGLHSIWTPIVFRVQFRDVFLGNRCWPTWTKSHSWIQLRALDKNLGSLMDTISQVKNLPHNDPVAKSHVNFPEELTLYMVITIIDLDKPIILHLVFCIQILAYEVWDFQKPRHATKLLTMNLYSLWVWYPDAWTASTLKSTLTVGPTGKIHFHNKFDVASGCK